MNSHEFYDGLFLAKMEAGLIEVEPLPKKRSKTEEEKLEEIQAMPSEKRHLLLLCDLSRNFKGSKEAVKQAEKLKKNKEYDKCKKLASRTWAFQRDYSRLKSYMAEHRWDKEFIKSRFGINFGAMTQLYFQCANL